MSNYGHPIRFGVEIFMESGQPGEAAELARHADELGFDLVTFSGSPAGDPLSIAAWTAVQTDRIRIVPAIRPVGLHASVLARSLASLQLLSKSRAELVLDANEIDLDVVEETIGVFRALLDTARAGRAIYEGTHHSLARAETGPALEHEVPVWIAGASSEVAELAGRLADGWLVDLDGIDLSVLARLNGMLDDAATSAGRDPREIRRSGIVDGDIEADALISLAVHLGMSSFVVRAGDEFRFQSFIAYIAPAVRQGVERALPPGALTGRPMRRADVRARRRSGIAYDNIPDELADTAVEPGDAAFASVRSTYMRGGNPGLVLRPESVDEVVNALAFARDHRHLPLGIRSGGHGVSGRSTNDGGLVIDVGRLNAVTVLDESSRLVRMGPGARWRDVATVLEPRGWALTSGDFGGVGVGGLATAGGIGFLGRKHGLTIDHLRAVDMVLADGRLVRASETENPELFWAVRGAGANFGIAVGFEFVVSEVRDVGWAQLSFQISDAAEYLQAFGQVASATPRETTPFLIISQGMAHVMAMVATPDPETIIGSLQPFAEIAPLVQQQVVIAPYAAVMNMFPEAPHSGRGEPVSRSAFVREMTPGFAAASAALIDSGASYWYQMRTVGGAIADVPSDATAYAHRDANFSLTVMGLTARRVDPLFDAIREESEGLYISFESDLRPERIHDAFPPAHLERLRRLKSELDPDNLFRDNFNIAPATSEDAS